QADREFLAADAFDRLLDPVLVNAEIFFPQIKDRITVLIDHGHVQIDQVRVDFDSVVNGGDRIGGRFRYVRLDFLSRDGFLVLDVFLLRGWFRLWFRLWLRPRRALGFYAADYGEARQRKDRRQRNDSPKSSFQHDNTTPNNVFLSFWV